MAIDTNYTYRWATTVYVQIGGSSESLDAAGVKSLYESNADTNAFTDADETKLDGIEAAATADQTAAEIRALVESATDSNVFTDADHSKLNAVEASVGVFREASEVEPSIATV